MIMLKPQSLTINAVDKASIQTMMRAHGRAIMPRLGHALEWCKRRQSERGGRNSLRAGGGGGVAPTPCFWGAGLRD